MFTHRDKDMEATGWTPDRHATADEARECEDGFWAEAEGHAQAQAEFEAERRHERWLEDGGHMHEIIAAEAAYERMVYGE